MQSGRTRVVEYPVDARLRVVVEVHEQINEVALVHLIRAQRIRHSLQSRGDTHCMHAHHIKMLWYVGGEVVPRWSSVRGGRGCRGAGLGSLYAYMSQYHMIMLDGSHSCLGGVDAVGGGLATWAFWYMYCCATAKRVNACM